MASKWIQTCPVALIEDTAGLLSLANDGRISFQMGADFNFDNLYGLIDHKHNLDNIKLFNLFKESIFNCYKKDQLKKPESLLLEFDKLCYKHNTKEKFIVITPITIRNIYSLPRLSTNNCTINFYNSVPKKYRKAREAELAASYSEEISREKELTIVTISTVAANTEAAITQANEAFDIIIALLQIGFTKNINILAMDDSEKYPSRSAINYGIFQTIHKANGTCWPNALWKNSDHVDRKPTTLKNQHNTISHLKKQLKKLEKLPYQSHLKSGLKNYTAALTHHNLELRFLKLWVTLEQLAMTDDTDKLIKRISFFYSNPSLHKLTLKSLRQSRNTYIHAGKSPTNIEMKIFQICIYTEHLLKFFLVNPFKHKTAREIEAFISLTTDATSISEQIFRLKTVQKFIDNS